MINPQQVLSALIVDPDHVELYRRNAQFKMQLDNFVSFTLPALLGGMARQCVEVQDEIDRRVQELEQGAEGRIFGSGQ